MNGIFLDHFPLKNFTPNKACCPLNPWMTSAILISRNRKENLFHKKIKNPTYTNLENFKNYNREYTKICRAAKIMYYKNQFDLASNNMKRSWSLIREVLGSPKKCQKLPGYFSKGTQKLTTPKDIAHGFNEFFSTIGSDLDSKLKDGKCNFKDMTCI